MPDMFGFSQPCYFSVCGDRDREMLQRDRLNDSAQTTPDMACKTMLAENAKIAEKITKTVRLTIY